MTEPKKEKPKKETRTKQKNPETAINQGAINLRQYAVACWYYRNSRNGLVTVNLTQASKVLGIQFRTFQRDVKKMVDLGLLEKTGIPGEYAVCFSKAYFNRKKRERAVARRKRKDTQEEPGLVEEEPGLVSPRDSFQIFLGIEGKPQTKEEKKHYTKKNAIHFIMVVSGIYETKENEESLGESVHLLDGIWCYEGIPLGHEKLNQEIDKRRGNYDACPCPRPPLDNEIPSPVSTSEVQNSTSVHPPTPTLDMQTNPPNNTNPPTPTLDMQTYPPESSKKVETRGMISESLLQAVKEKDREDVKLLATKIQDEKGMKKIESLREAIKQYQEEVIKQHQDFEALTERT